MKNLFGIFILMLFYSISFAQEGAKIEFKTETINFGEVVKGEDTGIRDFEFTNTGNANLVIMDVKSSYGCIISKKPNTAILPGESGKICIQYDMDLGVISKTITVETNAVNKPDGLIPLRIKGKVVKQHK